MKVARSRVDQTTAGKETIRTWAVEFGKDSHLTSGGAEVVQLKEEVMASTSAKREQTLTELHKDGVNVEVPTCQILAMKVGLNIP